MDDVLLIAHELLCAALFWTVFQRSVSCCARVRVAVRMAFFGLGLVACAGMAAPLAWHYVPDAFTVALQIAVCAVEYVTAHYWAAGVPDPFYKPGCAPRRRRAADFLDGGCRDHP